jgi:hypothetical protein
MSASIKRLEEAISREADGATRTALMEALLVAKSKFSINKAGDVELRLDDKHTLIIHAADEGISMDTWEDGGDMDGPVFSEWRMYNELHPDPEAEEDGPMKPNIITCHPKGWWYNDGRLANHWVGPFPTPEEAIKTARELAPAKSRTIKLVELAKWEQREVPVIEYVPCPHCDRGFTGGWDGDTPKGSSCRHCGGSGRLEDTDVE